MRNKRVITIFPFWDEEEEEMKPTKGLYHCAYGNLHSGNAKAAEFQEGERTNQGTVLGNRDVQVVLLLTEGLDTSHLNHLL